VTPSIPKQTLYLNSVYNNNRVFPSFLASRQNGPTNFLKMVTYSSRNAKRMDKRLFSLRWPSDHLGVTFSVDAPCCDLGSQAVDSQATSLLTAMGLVSRCGTVTVKSLLTLSAHEKMVLSKMIQCVSFSQSME
jgi:hypothetical protein